MKPLKAWAIVLPNGEINHLSDLYSNKREAVLALSHFAVPCKVVQVVITAVEREG